MRSILGGSKLRPIFLISIFLSACGGEHSADFDIDPPESEKNTSVLIEWLDNSNNEDGFMVERRLGEIATFAVIRILPKNSSSYSDNSELTTASDYCYRISSFNQAGISSSEEECIDTAY